MRVPISTFFTFSKLFYFNSSCHIFVSLCIAFPRVRLYKYEVNLNRSVFDLNGNQVSALEYLVYHLMEASGFSDLPLEAAHAVHSLVQMLKGHHILSFMNHESMEINDQVPYYHMFVPSLIDSHFC